MQTLDQMHLQYRLGQLSKTCDMLIVLQRLDEKIPPRNGAQSFSGCFELLEGSPCVLRRCQFRPEHARHVCQRTSSMEEKRCWGHGLALQRYQRMLGCSVPGVGNFVLGPCAYSVTWCVPRVSLFLILTLLKRPALGTARPFPSLRSRTVVYRRQRGGESEISVQHRTDSLRHALRDHAASADNLAVARRGPWEVRRGDCFLRLLAAA